MEIYFYGGGLNQLGFTDSIISASCVKKLYGGAEFEVILPLTEKNLVLAAKENIAELRGRFCGIITKISAGDGRIKLGGMSFDGFLSRRVLAEGGSGDSFFTLLDKNSGAASVYPHRRFGNTVFDKSCDRDNVYNDILKYRSLSFCAAYIGRRHGIAADSELVHGDERYICIFGRDIADRSISQSKNRAVILSDGYDNIFNGKAEISDGGRNGAAVWSEGKFDEKRLIDIKAYCGCVSPFGKYGYGLNEGAVKTEARTKYEQRGSAEEGTVTFWQVLDTDSMAVAADTMAAAVCTADEHRIELELRSGYAAEFDVGDIVTVKTAAVTGDFQVAEIRRSFGHGGTVSIVLSRDNDNNYGGQYE